MGKFWDFTAVFGHTASFGIIFQKCLYFCFIIYIYMCVCVCVIQGKDNPHFHKNISATAFINSCQVVNSCQ